MKSARIKLAGIGLAGLFAVAIATPSHAGAKDGDHYKIEWTATGCSVGKECTVTFSVKGNGGFHVNTEFPTTLKGYKPDPSKDAVSAVVGTPSAQVTEAGGKVTATVKLLSASPAIATAKFAVCSNDKKQCEPNAVDLTL